jgi:hypothetical protein
LLGAVVAAFSVLLLLKTLRLRQEGIHAGQRVQLQGLCQELDGAAQFSPLEGLGAQVSAPLGLFLVDLEEQQQEAAGKRWERRYIYHYLQLILTSIFCPRGLLAMCYGAGVRVASRPKIHTNQRTRLVLHSEHLRPFATKEQCVPYTLSQRKRNQKQDRGYFPASVVR